MIDCLPKEILPFILMLKEISFLIHAFEMLSLTYIMLNDISVLIKDGWQTGRETSRSTS